MMEELYYLLDLNGICLSEEKKERDRAIRLLLEVKKRKAKRYKIKEITDNYIIDVYRKKGMEGIKKEFNRNVCYLYSTIFVYDILFYHYKGDWKKIENIIKNVIS